MEPNLSVSEKLTYTTVRIELPHGTGTGFFFRFADSGSQHVPAIVTNKHVVDGAVSGAFCLTLADQNNLPTNAYERIALDNFRARWIDHPDPDVDLSVMPIAPLLKRAEELGKRFFYIPLDRSLIMSQTEMDELTAIEEIVMVGYPNGIWDSVNNRPIIRKGITATHPRVNHNGRQEFLVDVASFPGSSGSPVFLYNLGSYATRAGDLVVGGRVKCLGILRAVAQHIASGGIQFVNVPAQMQPVALTGIPNNLGVAIKAQRLLEFDSILQSRNNQ